MRVHCLGVQKTSKIGKRVWFQWWSQIWEKWWQAIKKKTCKNAFLGSISMHGKYVLRVCCASPFYKDDICLHPEIQVPQAPLRALSATTYRTVFLHPSSVVILCFHKFKFLQTFWWTRIPSEYAENLADVITHRLLILSQIPASSGIEYHWLWT